MNNLPKKRGSWVVLILWIIIFFPIAIVYFLSKSWGNDVQLHTTLNVTPVAGDNVYVVNNIKFDSYSDARQYCVDKNLPVSQIVIREKNSY